MSLLGAATTAINAVKPYWDEHRFISVAPVTLLAQSLELSKTDLPAENQPENDASILQSLYFYEIPPNLDPKTLTILTDLIQCESGGNPLAFNSMDTDGATSTGILQFREPTLFLWMKQYRNMDIEEPEVSNLIFDPQVQIDTFLAAYRTDGDKILGHFPACYTRYEEKWAELN